MPGAFISNDLASFFNPAEFGESDPVVINGMTVSGAIFDREDVEVQTGEGFGQIVPQPKITCKSADLSPLRSGQTAVVRGQNYRVKNWLDDGAGVTQIFLEGPIP